MIPKIKKIVDISMLLEEDLPSDPEQQIPRITRMDHKDTAPSRMATESCRRISRSISRRLAMSLSRAIFFF
jgi:hypothetical protein